MAIAIKVQVFNAGSPAPGLAAAPEITVRRETGAVVLGPVAMSDIGGGWYRSVFTPSLSNLDYSAEVDADPGATGQVTAGERYYSVAFDDELDEIWRDRGLDPSQDKTVTENVEGTDYTEAELGAGAGITKQAVKVGSVTTQTRT